MFKAKLVVCFLIDMKLKIGYHTFNEIIEL
jgi:hypothetical protein